MDKEENKRFVEKRINRAPGLTPGPGPKWARVPHRALAHGPGPGPGPIWAHIGPTFYFIFYVLSVGLFWATFSSNVSQNSASIPTAIQKEKQHKQKLSKQLTFQKLSEITQNSSRSLQEATKRQTHSKIGQHKQHQNPKTFRKQMIHFLQTFFLMLFLYFLSLGVMNFRCWLSSILPLSPSDWAWIESQCFWDGKALPRWN